MTGIEWARLGQIEFNRAFRERTSSMVKRMKMTCSLLANKASLTDGPACYENSLISSVRLWLLSPIVMLMKMKIARLNWNQSAKLQASGLDLFPKRTRLLRA